MYMYIYIIDIKKKQSLRCLKVYSNNINKR